MADLLVVVHVCSSVMCENFHQRSFLRDRIDGFRCMPSHIPRSEPCVLNWQCFKNVNILIEDLRSYINGKFGLLTKLLLETYKVVHKYSLRSNDFTVKLHADIWFTIDTVRPLYYGLKAI